jgi:nitrous oxidase accessory protein NosD
MRICSALVVSVVILSGLTGCAVRGPSIKVEPPQVLIPGVIVEGKGHSKHCPPGQAKKGKC